MLGTLCSVNDFPSLAVSIVVGDEFGCNYLRAEFPFSTRCYVGMKLLICNIVSQKVIRKQFVFSVGNSRFLFESF